ncbi:MAG: M20/M25/M40 family metallo-hydrolase [Proteobacteria bacterium]|nr:M20/M25/M40 family metallo-hydrolase [Pseudomonadota bacterium]
MKRVALAAFVVACDPSGSASSPDATLDSTMGCDLPALAAPWLAPELHDAIGALAVPRATISERSAARTWLAQRLTALGWSPEVQSYAGGANVVATIPSTTGSTDQLIVGAHFDTVAGSPGANDDASGVAVVLAVAHYLADTPCRTPNVVVAFFDQEEGLFGSRALAQRLVADGAVVRAVHTVDQVAWDGDHDRVIELEQPTSALAAAYRAAAEVVGVPVSVVGTGGTDHVSFRDEGFPAIGITEEYAGGDTSPYRHTAQDTAATVDEAYLALATQLVAHVITSATR